MKSLECALLCCVISFAAAGCSRRSESESGKVDEWTWNSLDLKTRTSPDKVKRVRADSEDGKIILSFGEAGADHPLDVMIHRTEIIPAPKNGSWEMRWLSDSEFVFEHPELGSKTWTIEGGDSMIVHVKTDWQTKAKP